MKSISSGKTKGSHPQRKKKRKKKKINKKKKYTKFLKRFKKRIKTTSEQSQDELVPIISTPIISPMSDE